MSQPLYYTGIYFLLRDGVVVYVGKTTKFPLRLVHHQQQLLPFDAVHFIQCKEELLDSYEQRWIRWFNPEFNTAHKIERPKRLKIKVQKFKKQMKFRKLSKKSFIGFGPHRDDTVEQILKRGKQLDLVKMYYSLSHISFLDDLLTELGITGSWLIEKPGIKPEKFFEFGYAHYPETMEHRRERARTYDYKQSKSSLAAITAHNGKKLYHKNFNQKP